MAQYFIQNGKGNQLLMIGIFFIPVIVYFIWWFVRVRKNEKEANFRNTVRMNWLAATCTNLSFLMLLIWRWFE